MRTWWVYVQFLMKGGVAYYCAQASMVADFEYQIAQRAIKAGVLVEKELTNALEILEICHKHQIKISLSQFIFQAYADNVQLRQQYLMCLVHELMTPELRLHIDPYGMGMEPSWKMQLEDGKRYLENEDVRARVATIQQQFEQLQLQFSQEHIALLLQEKSECAWPKSPAAASASEYKLNFVNFCKRMRQSELLAPNTKISRLCSSTLRMENIERVLMAQKEILNKFAIKIPIPHLLITLYDLEPYLLHALLLAQLDTEEELASWWGGMMLQKLPAVPNIQILQNAQQQCLKFLEESFHITWLEFQPEQEFELVEYFEKTLSANIIDANREIQKNFPQEANLSFLKILALREAILPSQLLAGVLHIIHKIPLQQAQQIVAPLKKQEMQKEIAPTAPASSPSQTISRSLPPRSQTKVRAQLGQTMAVSRDQLANKSKSAPDAAHRIMERLKKSRQVSVDKPEPTPPPVAEPTSAPTTPKAQAPSSLLIPITAETVRIREAIQRKMISEQDAIDGVSFQIEQGLQQKKSLLDILVDREMLSREHYSELQILSAQPQKIRVAKKEQDIDLMLAEILVDYHMLPRERIQKFLHWQNSLYSLGISKSLAELLITSNALAADMVTPLVAECKRRKEGTPREDSLGQTMRVPYQPPPKLTTDAKRDNQYLWPAVVAVGLILILAIYQLPVFWETNKAQRQPVTRPPSKPKIAKTSQKPPAPKPKPKPSKQIQPPVEKVVTTPKIVKRIRETPKYTYIAPLSLSNEKLVYRKSPAKGILSIQGQIANLVLPDKTKGIQVQLVLWDLWKYQAHYSTTSLLTQENFTINLPLYPLMPGIYYIHFSILPSMQSSQVQKNIIREKYEWWLPFIVDKSAVKSIVTQNFADLENILDKIKRQYEELQKILEFSRKKNDTQWRLRNARWEKKQKQLHELCNERQQKYLVPFCPQINKDLWRLLEYLRQYHADLSMWVQGYSLIPPDMLPEINDFVTLLAEVTQTITKLRNDMDGVLKKQNF